MMRYFQKSHVKKIDIHSFMSIPHFMKLGWNAPSKDPRGDTTNMMGHFVRKASESNPVPDIYYLFQANKYLFNQHVKNSPAPP